MLPGACPKNAAIPKYQQIACQSTRDSHSAPSGYAQQEVVIRLSGGSDRGTTHMRSLAAAPFCTNLQRFSQHFWNRSSRVVSLQEAVGQCPLGLHDWEWLLTLPDRLLIWLFFSCWPSTLGLFAVAAFCKAIADNTSFLMQAEWGLVCSEAGWAPPLPLMPRRASLFGSGVPLSSSWRASRCGVLPQPRLT